MVGSRRVLRGALFSLAGALAGGCSGLGNITGGSQPAVSMNNPQSPATSQGVHHLYAAQGFYGASLVYRFPLRADGLPSKKPDGKLKLDFPFPGAIAIGPDGRLYVSSSGGVHGCRKNACFVAVFAPGSVGNVKPIRVLDVPQTPNFLAVDQRGYLDVSTIEGGGKVTNVYRPGAKGKDAPINQITTPGINALAARSDIVYIQTLQLGTGVEGVHEHSSNSPPVLYTYDHYASSNGVAADTTHLYAQFFWPAISAYDLATAVYRIDTPGQAIRTIIDVGCQAPANGGALGYGIAVYKKYLFEGCLPSGGGAGSVQVYDSTKSGPQSPLAQVPGGDTGVAIGP